MNYDPDARRDTPLSCNLIARIKRDGPLTVRQYMTACLQDADHGYYRRREAIGRTGDFITAPEISQIFGELIGLWSAVVWQQMGSPSRINLIELGPGRGSLMRDALRALRLVPDFLSAANVHLVESSETLRAAQTETLGAIDLPINWHPRLEDVPEGPTIVIGNEFLDALPVEQLIATPSGWRCRSVTVDDLDRLQFGEIALPPSGRLDIPVHAENAPAGSILTVPDFSELSAPLASLGKSAPLAALLIDYGHAASEIGDSLQAVRDHHHEHPLTSPGEADLTTQVDFEAVRTQITMSGSENAADPALVVDGPITQAEFLGALGIVQRASRLMAANPIEAGNIELGVARLLAPQGMGTRFKALGVRSGRLPTLPGF